MDSCLFNCKYPGIINVRIFTEELHNHDGTGLSQVVLNAIHNLVYRLQVYVQNAAFGTGEPGFEYRIGLLILFHQRQRTAVHQHQHQRFTGRFQRANEGAT